MISDDELLEAWRAHRRKLRPPAGFAGRVMQAVDLVPVAERRDEPPGGGKTHWSRGLRTGLMAAAVAVALFRAAELLSVFVPTGIEN